MLVCAGNERSRRKVWGACGEGAGAGEEGRGGAGGKGGPRGGELGEEGAGEQKAGAEEAEEQ